MTNQSPLVFRHLIGTATGGANSCSGVNPRVRDRIVRAELGVAKLAGNQNRFAKTSGLPWFSISNAPKNPPLIPRASDVKAS